MAIDTTQDLLAQELRDIEDAERRAAEALPRMIGLAGDDELVELLERRRAEGEDIAREAAAALEALGGGGEAEDASAARGIIEATLARVEQAGTPELKRAVIIAGAQKLEHYCIAAWGTVKALADELDAPDLAQVMESAVEEGYRWDAEMSDLAESRINPEVMEAEIDAERG